MDLMDAWSDLCCKMFDGYVRGCFKGLYKPGMIFKRILSELKKFWHIGTADWRCLETAYVNRGSGIEMYRCVCERCLLAVSVDRDDCKSGQWYLLVNVH